MRTTLGAILFCLGVVWFTAASAQTPVLSDNFDSIAVVIGNKEYRRTSTVDFAHNDADAIKAYLTGTLGFREQNILLVKDATLGELSLMFGSEANPQGGQLWRSVISGRSNVFVYYSGHGVPDLTTRQPFLLPHDGNPNVAESGYALQTLYRNLELVRQKIGAQRQLIVMIDACFTGETGRKGESLLAVSAPGFTPAKPRTGSGIVKLVATSGTTPANWDENQKLGLFTSRFLMGAAGLARPAGAPETGPLAWSDLQRYLKGSVEAAARRDSGREQTPEIDLASIALPVAQPVPAVARAVALARDETNWQRAKAAGERSALEAYVARCGETCGYREAAMALLLDKHRSGEAATDEQNWVRLGGSGRYEDYLKGCGTVCAYRSIAEGYLSRQVSSDGAAGSRGLPYSQGIFQPRFPPIYAPKSEPEPVPTRVSWRTISGGQTPVKEDITAVLATAEFDSEGFAVDIYFDKDGLRLIVYRDLGTKIYSGIDKQNLVLFKKTEQDIGITYNGRFTQTGYHEFSFSILRNSSNKHPLEVYSWVDIPTEIAFGGLIRLEIGKAGKAAAAEANKNWKK